VSSFFTATGAYGGLAWRGLLAYAVGLGAEAPFVSQPPRYVGVLVRHLGGADISWIVGWIVAAGLYLILARVGGNRPAEAGPESAAAA
jgi:NCS1 family nucleobase:cation symporter-1